MLCVVIGAKAVNYYNIIYNLILIMCSSYNKSTKNRKASKRKCNTSLDSSKNDMLPTKDPDVAESSHYIWSTYYDIYDTIAANPSEVQTTAECVAKTRVIDVATTKLIDDVQKLDLSSVDLWTDIAERLVIGWNKFFHGPDNIEDWSLGDLVPLNRCKSIFFNSRSLLLKRYNPEHKPVASQKKQRITRRDDNSQSKTAKPLQGFAEDKPPLLIEHMERIKSVLSTKNDSFVPYMKLVLHPTSFPWTVYNIFAVAFLVREGMVSLTIGNDDEPMVKLLSNSHSINPESDNRKKSNFLVSFTTEEWRMLVKKLNITSPLIQSPDGTSDEDEFYEKFTMSQKERRKEKK